MQVQDVSTFHSVYISTNMDPEDAYAIGTLHSTLFILVRNYCMLLPNGEKSLHSTLFILVRLLNRIPEINDPLYIPLCLY